MCKLPDMGNATSTGNGVIPALIGGAKGGADAYARGGQPPPAPPSMLQAQPVQQTQQQPTIMDLFKFLRKKSAAVPAQAPNDYSLNP